MARSAVLPSPRTASVPPRSAPVEITTVPRSLRTRARRTPSAFVALEWLLVTGVVAFVVALATG
jgi:hypothetical protein